MSSQRGNIQGPCRKSVEAMVTPDFSLGLGTDLKLALALVQVCFEHRECVYHPLPISFFFFFIKCVKLYQSGFYACLHLQAGSGSASFFVLGHRDLQPAPLPHSCSHPAPSASFVTREDAVFLTPLPVCYSLPPPPPARLLHCLTSL